LLYVDEIVRNMQISPQEVEVDRFPSLRVRMGMAGLIDCNCRNQRVLLRELPDFNFRNMRTVLDATFFQIEWRVSLLIDLQLASQIP
jgi:hypothetical protein